MIWVMSYEWLISQSTISKGHTPIRLPQIQPLNLCRNQKGWERNLQTLFPFLLFGLKIGARLLLFWLLLCAAAAEAIDINTKVLKRGLAIVALGADQEILSGGLRSLRDLVAVTEHVGLGELGENGKTFEKISYSKKVDAF